MSAPFPQPTSSPAQRGFLFADWQECASRLRPRRDGLSETVVALTKDEQRLLDRLSAESRVTALTSVEINMAKALERADLVFLVPDGSGGAVITPKGRRLLAERARRNSAKKPFGFF